MQSPVLPLWLGSLNVVLGKGWAGGCPGGRREPAGVKASSGSLSTSVVFWFGDLNFRIESLDIRFVKYAIDNSILHQLWEKDQVRSSRGRERRERVGLQGEIGSIPEGLEQIAVEFIHSSEWGRKNWGVDLDVITEKN